MTPVSTGRKPRGSRGAARRPPLEGVVVDEEQRRRMIECCAYFHAARYRPARPGDYRKEDLVDAEVCIDEIIARHKPR